MLVGAHIGNIQETVANVRLGLVKVAGAYKVNWSHSNRSDDPLGAVEDTLPGGR